MKEDFKNIVKNTVDNFSDEINPDLIWGGIETKMGKKNQVSGFWIFGGLSLVVASLFFAWMYNYSVGNPSANLVTDSNNNEVINVAPKQEVVQEQKSGSIELSVDKISNDRVEATTINVEDNEAVHDQPIDYKESKNINVEKVNNTKKGIIANKKVEVTNIQIGSNAKKEGDKTKNIATENISKETTTTKFIGSTPERNSLLTEPEHPSFKADAASNIITLGPTEDREMSVPIDVAEIKDRNPQLFFFHKREIIVPDAKAFKSIIPRVAAENKIRVLSGIEIYGGIFYGSKTVRGIDQSYATVRNDSEKLLEQWSTGIRVNLIKLKDFKFRSGVRFSMITDRVLKANEYLDQSNYSYVTSRLDGDAIVQIDNLITSDSIPFSGTYTIEQYNSQRIISIPMEITFGKSFNKIDLGISFGVDINYQLKDTHVILDQNEKASLNRVGGKWVSPSLSAGLSAGYKINDTWSIISSVNFRQVSLSDHESISTQTSSYKLYGLELGLRKSIVK